jgi:hypothetical protein
MGGPTSVVAHTHYPEKTNNFPYLNRAICTNLIKMEATQIRPRPAAALLGRLANSLRTLAADEGYFGPRPHRIGAGRPVPSGRDQCLLAVLSGGFDGERFIAKRARFLARRLGRETPQQG